MRTAVLSTLLGALAALAPPVAAGSEGEAGASGVDRGLVVLCRKALVMPLNVEAQQVVDNARALADVMLSRGFDIVSGGTDTHLALIDMRPKGLKGNMAEESLERAGMTCNKNGVPFDPEKPTITSGIRVGTPAGTTRGFGIAEFQQIGHLMADVLEALAANPDDNSAAENAAREQVRALCDAFPIYQ